MKFDYKRIIRYPYCMVPNCPACGSHRTGRFFKEGLGVDVDWTINDGLKNGELLEPAPQIDPDGRLFCLDCHFTWTDIVHTKWLTLYEIEEEKRSRGTYELLKMRSDEKAADFEKKSGVLEKFKKWI